MTYQLHIVHDDMKYGYIERVGRCAGRRALSVALEGTDGKCRADPTAAGSVHFYDNSRQECITKIHTGCGAGISSSSDNQSPVVISTVRAGR